MRPTVLYVTGWCRDASTVLGDILGELPNVFHAGELRFLWRDGVLRDGSKHRCGCGVDLDRCPVWSQVLAAVTPPQRDPLAHAEDVVRDQSRWRTRDTRRALRGRVRGVWPRTLADTYESIADVTGADIVVDTSGFASDAALARRSGFATPVVHLVQDPRAAAFSWLAPTEHSARRGALESTRYWLGFNHAGQRLVDDDPARSTVLRYEDLVARPRASIELVLGLIGREQHSPVPADGRVTLGANHTVISAPNRVERGDTRLRTDDRWRGGLGWGRRVAVSALAAPQLRRYSYSWVG